MASRLFFVLLLVLLFSNLGAEVYRWKDENGKIHFGDSPPAGAKTEAVDVPDFSSAPQIPSDSERFQARQKILDAGREKRAAKRQAKAEAKREKENRERRCTYYTGLVEHYERGSALYDPLPDGERRYYSEQEREAEIAKVRKAKERWCSQ